MSSNLITMTSKEAFKSYQLKLDKLDTEDNIDISPGEFVIIYNEVKNKWFESKFKNISTRDLDEIQSLVRTNIKLEVKESSENKVTFKIPEDFFDYITSHTIANRGCCKNRLLYNNEVKLQDLNYNLKNSYSNPSFDYEETVLTIGNNEIAVYKTDFDIDSVECTYYKYPGVIDIEGYTKFGIPSTNINPDVIKKLVDEIIDWCVIETQRRYYDAEGFQFSQTR